MSRATALPPARIVVFLGVLFAALGLLITLGTSTASAAKPCWERVIDDWVDNGRFDGVYSPACLQAALKHVPEDIRAYSDFEDRLKQARQDSVRLRALQSTGSGTSKTNSSGRNQQVVREVEPNVSTREPDGGPITSALRYRTNDASSIPLPLIVLTGLALVLLTAGGAGFAHRKLQARKIRS
jgi:hypothetical protein